MKIENENTQNKARRFRIVVTDLQEDKTLTDVTTNTAIIGTSSSFDNLANVDRDGHTQRAQYFNCTTDEIIRCVQCIIKGISELAAKHKELGLLLGLWLMANQLKNEEEDNEDE